MRKILAMLAIMVGVGMAGAVGTGAEYTPGDKTVTIERCVEDERQTHLGAECHHIDQLNVRARMEMGS